MIGSNFVLSIFEDCQLLGEAQFKKPMSGHKSSIEMPHGACKFKSLVLCKMFQDIFVRAVHDEQYGQKATYLEFLC